MESLVVCVAGDFVRKHTCVGDCCKDSQRMLADWQGNKCSTQGPSANDKNESQKLVENIKSNWNTEHVDYERNGK